MVNPTFQRGAASIEILGKFSRQSLGSFQCLSDFGLHKKMVQSCPMAKQGALTSLTVLYPDFGG